MAVSLGRFDRGLDTENGNWRSLLVVLIPVRNADGHRSAHSDVTSAWTSHNAEYQGLGSGPPQGNSLVLRGAGRCSHAATHEPGRDTLVNARTSQTPGRLWRIVAIRALLDAVGMRVGMTPN